MKPTLLLLFLACAARGQVTNQLAVITREVKTNYNSIGQLMLHNGSNYNVSLPQVWTNVVMRAQFEGKSYELMLRCDPGEASTNACDMRYEPLETPPVPVARIPHGNPDMTVRMPILPERPKP